jgi:predicted nucleotidyltransferase
MLKKSYKIIDVFAKNPTIPYLFKEIKEQINSKSESYTYNSLKAFSKEGILIKEKKGGLSSYKIANNSKTISYLSLVAEYKAWNKKGIPTKLIYDLIEKIDINFFTLLVVGSYAKNKQTEKSDLDVILIMPEDVKKITSKLRYFCEMTIPQIHLHVFSGEEFKNMLLDKKHNFGKEAVKNNLLFYGAQPYYKIIFEAMKNGFTF